MTEIIGTYAICIIADNKKGVLHEIAGVMAEHDANITMVHMEEPGTTHNARFAALYIEYEIHSSQNLLLQGLNNLEAVSEIHPHQSFKEIFGTRVIIIGGGAQVAQVAMGAVNEADRHNIRGERISIDTIPLVGEETLANAVDAVPRLPRASILVLAGSLMGGKVSEAVLRVKREGIPVIALNMAGTVPECADIVVTDPIQAGVFAVMHVSSIAVFDITRIRGRRF